MEWNNEVKMNKKAIIFSVLFLAGIALLADRVMLQTEILRLRHALESLEKSNAALKNTLQQQQSQVRELQQRLHGKETHFQSFGDFLKTPAVTYAIIAIAVIICLNIMLFLMLKCRLPLDGNATDGPSCEFGKRSGDTQSPTPESPAPADHILALRVGLEIHRMRKRMEQMPEKTRHLKALKNSLKRLEDAFNDKGYEMIDLLGKPFSDGLTLHARFAPSDELQENEQIITKVITPQINFKDVLIQAAEVEVSSGV